MAVQSNRSNLTYRATPLTPHFWRILIILCASLAGFGIMFWLAPSNGPSSPPLPPLAVAPVEPEFLGCKSSDCGNGVCETGGDICPDQRETCASCTTDCCPGNITPQCGPCDNDTVCEAPCESVFNCGDCPSFCGDGICAAHEVNNCCGPGMDCTVEITCGDGICSACENAENCTEDQCAPPGPSDTPTEPPSPTFTATFTRVPVTTAAPGTATDTPEPTDTARPTATSPADATDTPTPTATRTATPTTTPEPDEEAPECGLVAYESRPEGWQDAYKESTDPEGFIPVRDDDQEVWVCPTPPEGEELCIPVYEGLLEAVNFNAARVKLVECQEDGTCQVFDQPGSLQGNLACYTIGDLVNPSCEVGCALAPDEAGFPWWILLIVLLLLILILIYLATRRRDEEGEAEVR